jgi:hypothetical protein
VIPLDTGYPPTAEHGLIGDRQTAALVSALDNPADRNRLTARLVAAVGR